MNNLDKTLLALSGTDLARLAIPKIPDLNRSLFGGDLIARMELMTKQANQISAAHQIAITGLVPKISQLAKMIEQQNKPHILAFQTISERIQPLILHQSKLAEKLKSFSILSNPTLEAIKTLSSYNAFDRYRKTFEEFGGFLDPDNVTEEEIEQTIVQNSELFEEVNTVVLTAEIDGVSPGDVPALIFSFLQKRVPYLSKKTFGIIVLIYTTVIITYGLHSNYSTNSAIEEEIIPTQYQNSEVLQDLKNGSEEINISIDELSEKLDDTGSDILDAKSSVNELKMEVEQYMEQTNDKLDLLFNEMKKQQSKNE